MAALPVDRVRRLRLAAQRLTPSSAAATALEATRSVVGIQAQDVRASGLSLRSRVPGLTRAALDADPGLVRTWTFRGTVHLIAADDLPWIHALTGARNAARFEAWIEKRGEVELFRELRPAIADRLHERPMAKAELLESLAADGHPVPRTTATNVLMPWLAAQGLVSGLPDGRFRASEPPPPVDEDDALETMGRRYLAGHAPAGPPDLARWSGLPLGMARRALDAAGARAGRRRPARPARRARRGPAAGSAGPPAGGLRHLDARAGAPASRWSPRPTTAKSCRAAGSSGPSRSLAGERPGSGA